MRLTDLEPHLVTRTENGFLEHDDFADVVDGLFFLCPACFAANGNSNVGTHSVLCWQPHIPQDVNPVPGRWSISVPPGQASYENVTLVAGSSSVWLQGSKCGAHFFVRAGAIESCPPGLY